MTFKQWPAVLAVLLLAAVSSPSTATSPLRPLGPHRGNLRAVAAFASAPSHPGRVFAVFDRGGIARSDDGGRTWRVMSDGLSGPAVGSIVVHPRLGRLVFAVGGHLFRSLDAGRTWTPLPLHGVTTVALDPRDPVVVWAGTARGLFRSRNTGQTWERIQANLPQPYGVYLLAVDHLDPQRLYIRLLGPASRDLWTSGDGGRSWVSRRAPFQAAWLYTDLHAAQTLYFGDSDGNRILRSRDAGQTWERFLDISYHPLGGVMAGDPRDPSTFFVPLFTDGGSTMSIYRTTDAGLHWRPLPRGLSSPLHVRALTVGADGTVLLAAEFDKFEVFRSVDSGDHWDLVARGPSFLRVDAIAVTGPGALFIGLPQDGVERSLDNGATWTLSLPLFPSPTSIIADPHDSETLYVSTNYPYSPGVGIVWKTVDGGESWVSLPYPFAADEVVDGMGLAIDDSGTLYLVAKGGIFRSRDSGQTWENVVGQAFNSTGVAAQGGTVLAQASDGIYRSTDHGDTWTRVLTQEGDSSPMYVGFSPADPDIVYAVLGTLFRSDDGGATFASLGEPIQRVPLALDPVDPATIVFPTLRSTLVRLTLGQGRELIQGILGDYVQTLAFDPNDTRRLLIGTGNTGLMEYRFGTSPTP